MGMSLVQSAPDYSGNADSFPTVPSSRRVSAVIVKGMLRGARKQTDPSC